MKTKQGVADIEGFIGALVHVTLEGDKSQYSPAQIKQSRESIKALCHAEVKKLRAELATASVKRQFTHYRNAIREHYKDKTVVLTIKSQFGRKLDKPQHIALRYFILKKSERSEIKEKDQSRKDKYLLANDSGVLGSNDLSIIVNHTAYIDTARRLATDGQTFYEVATGLTALTGRRPFAEILRMALDDDRGFKKTGAHTVAFIGQAKASQARREKAYQINTLSSADDVIKGLERLRAMPKKPSVFASIEAGTNLSGLSGEARNREINNRIEASCSRPLGNVVKKHFTRYVQRCLSGNMRALTAWHVSPKNLRPIAAQLTHSMYASTSDLHAYARKFLGHSSSTYNSSDNYMEFRLHPKEVSQYSKY